MPVLVSVMYSVFVLNQSSTALIGKAKPAYTRNLIKIDQLLPPGRQNNHCME